MAHGIPRLEKRGIDTEKPSNPVVRIALPGYNRIAAIAMNALTQISLVTPAPGDEATVALWLQELDEQIERSRGQYKPASTGRSTVTNS
jgi:hypothetical protein